MKNQNFEVIARALVIKENKILLCHGKKDDYYYLPGGHVEFGEFIEDALKRETMEELGVKTKSVESLFMLQNIFEQKGIKRHEFNHVFKVELETYDFNITEDHIEFFWYDISKLENINFLPEEIKEKVVGGIF
jgi:ADP-ribose pyrophosphatase YjhB (NUDIX family)